VKKDSIKGARAMAQATKSVDPMTQIARSLDLLVKLKIEEVKKDRSQREMIHFLFGLGVGSGDIATLLGVNRTTVDPELSKLRSKENKSAESKKNSSAAKRKG
jgi:hypothetical protein